MYRVLVVDDNAAIREGMRVLIDWNRRGFDAPLTARNGSDALGLLEREPVQLLITDVRMPVLDGISLLREVSRRRMPVRSVILSGYRDFEYAQAALECRAVRYLLKPVNERQLEETVEGVRRELDQAPPAPALPEDAFSQMLAYVDDHLCDRLSLKALAAKYHFNPAYLGRLFAKRTGEDFNDYMGARRARIAAQMFEREDLPVAEIAQAVGYCDADHFSVVFKRAFGMTPSEYRQRAASNV